MAGIVGRVRRRYAKLKRQREAAARQAEVDARLARYVTLGRHTYPRKLNVVHFETYAARLDIGAFCSIADGAEFILDGEHNAGWVTTFPVRVRLGLPGAGHDGHPATRGDIRIGNDVWIGRGATILSGISIGDGAVVGARAVVASDVPAYGVVVGNPARLVRKRFRDDQIEALLRIRWWEWSDEEVVERVGALCDADIDGFIARYDPGA